MPFKILVLEDVPEMGELIRTTLVGGGPVPKEPLVEVTLVRTVVDAFRALLKDRPHGVLLDEIVPGENPLELLQEPALQGVPVVLITASAIAGRALPVGVLARLPKWGWKDVNRARAQVLELLNRG
jgi:CheY-like chemotaxis protein